MEQSLANLTEIELETYLRVIEKSKAKYLDSPETKELLNKMAHYAILRRFNAINETFNIYEPSN